MKQRKGRGRPKKVETIIREIRNRAMGLPANSRKRNPEREVDYLDDVPPPTKKSPAKSSDTESSSDSEEESYFDLPFIPPEEKEKPKELQLPFIPGKDSWTVPRIPADKIVKPQNKIPSSSEERKKVAEPTPPITTDPAPAAQRKNSDPTSRNMNPSAQSPQQKPKVTAPEPEKSCDLTPSQKNFTLFLPRTYYMKVDLCQSCVDKMHSV